jgi:iron complex outermembrane recepter protein
MRTKNKEQRQKIIEIYALCSLFFALVSIELSAQSIDTVHLHEANVTAYFGERPLLSSPSSVGMVDSLRLSSQAKQSFVPVLNSISGVRMEERSPGSYRLSIRGSLLRSPFGIRNVKIYIDEFPLTDAGGNTYLNLIDPNVVKKMEVLKGPDGSLFGANSGGVVRIYMINPVYDSTKISAGITAGSYGLFHEQATLQRKFNNGIFSVSGAWKYSDGYRGNSGLDQEYVQTAGKWNYSSSSQLRWMLFYSDLHYETPGGLTLQQMQDDPNASRPATATLPGASEQKAGVYNKTIYAGLLDEISLGTRSRYVFALFGSHTDFQNPFITNYEVRNENSGGLRTWFELNSRTVTSIQWKWNIGVESQQTGSHIRNYDNLFGIKDSLQNDDHLDANQSFAFTRFVIDVNRWVIETSVSLNFNRYQYKRFYPVVTIENDHPFDAQLMPRIAASYRLTNLHYLRASVSRGYSAPTLSEIRSSDNVINTTLQPESGWNYETGFRMQNKSRIIWWDLSVFYYELQNAIVRRVNEEGEEFFVNAGGTAQPGLESQYHMTLIRNNNGLIRGMDISNGYTFSLFRFKDYKDESNDYSGNKLTGVPQHIIVTGLHIALPYSFYITPQHYFSDEIPLNDLNDEYADAYHLLQIKAGWKYNAGKGFVLELSAGADNLLNEKYSSGNDLNAAGRRYYNPAPVRNYFVSAAFKIN